MDVALISCGLGLLGYLVNKQDKKYDTSDIYNKEFDDKNIVKIKKYNTNDSDIYINKSIKELDKSYTKKKIDLYNKSLMPDSNIVNGIWRILNDKEKNKKMNDKVNKNINKDLNNLKNIKHNNIESMMNIYNNSTNNQDIDKGDEDMTYSDNDSIFSEDISLNKISEQRSNMQDMQNRQRQKNIEKINRQQQYNDNYISDDNESEENSSYENINTRVLNTQERFMDDIATSLSGEFLQQSVLEDEIEYNSQVNEFESQFDELKFDHKGIPGTMPPDRKMLKTFNENMDVIPESEFKADCDGRYGVTSDMNHGNMVPFFKSTTYGFNPSRDKQMENFATRNIELFTGSDQNPQFKHKQEVKKLFPNEIGKVESVTGLPNFSDYFESRYIPSQTRNGELLTQPIRDTPGLDLGYTQRGSGNDLYRALPKTVDQIRTINNPKISYETPVVPGQKGYNGRVMGKMVQQGPDRYYYNSPDSMLPQVGEFEAPAMYGKFIVNPTNRSMNPDNGYVGPATTEVSKNTPEYLQGQYKNPFKKSSETNGPRNVTHNNRGQIINQESWTPNETGRQSVNYGDKYLGPTGNNKTQGYLLNNENAIPELTNRNMTQNNEIINIKGNYEALPLINFINMIPDVTKKQILLEDNGKKNLTNVSNSIKGYLFNSINAIPDETLRSILTEKVILANTKGNSERGYLFNNENNIADPNMRNISENTIVPGNLSNHEKSYLFNYLDNIPDINLRNIINTIYSSEGLNIKGNHGQSYLVDYDNAIPEATMRQLTENVINLTNVSGPVEKGYLLNYVNAIPEKTMKELTENTLALGSMTPIQRKGYLIDYISAIPDATFREISENNTNILNIKGNHMQEYMFNYENGVPDQTLRNIVENISQLGNFKGNHSSGYIINYINTIPDSTLRELTENTTNITNINPLKMKGYLINYVNSVPDATLREMTENQQNIIGIKGNHNKTTMFNYDNGIPDPTNRNQTENQKNIIGTKGNHNKIKMFNYDNGVPDPTNRNQTENQKNIIGTKGNHNKIKMFNYDNGIPDPTNRNQTENQKNIIGTKGNHNKTKMFNYDNGIPDPTVRSQTENKKNITGVGSAFYNKEYLFNYENGIPDVTIRSQTENKKNITGQKGQGTQNRSRLDYSNAILNTEKEVIAKGRAPVSVKNNLGPTSLFKQYVFNDDNMSENRTYASNMQQGSIKNELYSFTGGF
jgi:hypothetical protein